MLLRQQLDADLKNAMRARESEKVGVFRLIFSEIKQKEVDSQRALEAGELLLILEKMIKQRKDSITQFDKAGRTDLVEKEQAELTIIQSYLPEALSEDEIITLIDAAIIEVSQEKGQEKSPALMGMVIAKIRPQLAGRAEMSVVSSLVKKSLHPASSS